MSTLAGIWHLDGSPIDPCATARLNQMIAEYAPDSIQLTESAKFVERCAQSGVRAEYLRTSAEFTLEARG